MMHARFTNVMLRLLLPLLWAGVGAGALGAPPAAPSPAATAAPTSATESRDPGFYVKIDPAEARIGDPVVLTLEWRNPGLTPDRIVSVPFTPDPERWHMDIPFRRDWSSPANKDGAWLASVRPFDTGRLPIPPLKVAYRDAAGRPAEAMTTTATLNVLPIRPPNDRNLILWPLRDPAEIPRDWTWLWLAVGALFLCGLAIWAALRLWTRRQAAVLAPPEPELPPGIWALRELDYRSRLPVCQSGPAKPIFSHASEVIRLYLGRRYGVSAIDMTTYECLRALHPLQPGDEVLRWVREFLDECDLVKFTTLEPPRGRWQTIWHDARLIVKMTTPPEELDEPANHGSRPREVAV